MKNRSPVGSLRQPDSINLERGNVSTENGTRLRYALEVSNDGVRLYLALTLAQCRCNTPPTEVALVPRSKVGNVPVSFAAASLACFT